MSLPTPTHDSKHLRTPSSYILSLNSNKKRPFYHLSADLCKTSSFSIRNTIPYSKARSTSSAKLHQSIFPFSTNIPPYHPYALPSLRP